MKNILAMILGLCIGGGAVLLSAGCAPELAVKRHELRNHEWIMCAADRSSSVGCQR
jgi:hypothetical protein